MSHARHMIAGVLLLVGLAAGGLAALDGKWPAPAVPVVPAPSGLLAGVGRADAAIIRGFYEAMADIVERDGAAEDPVVKSTLDLRNRHRDALKLAFANTALVGKYAGLGERLDAHLLQAIGETDVPLDSAMRQKAAAAFRAVE